VPKDFISHISLNPIFTSQEYLDDYLKSELLLNFKSFPHITDLKVDIYNIIGGTELTMSVNPW